MTPDKHSSASRAATSRAGTTGATHPPCVAIIGAGITGLVAASTLASAGARVVVVESSARVGGKIRTEPFAGVSVDVGPDSFLARRPEAVDLCRQLGMADRLVAPAEKRAYVWSRGRLRPLPAGLMMGAPSRLSSVALSGILSPWGTLRAGLDLVLPRTGGSEAYDPGSGYRGGSGAYDPGSGEDREDRKDREDREDRSIGELVARRLGREAASRLVDPLAGGVHAGSSFELSAAMVFPQLLIAASKHRSLVLGLRREAARTSSSTSHPGPMFFGLPEGLSTIPERLAGTLAGSGVDIRLLTPARSLLATSSGWIIEAGDDRIAADAVIIASPARSAALLLADVAQDAAAILSRVEHASVGIVTMSYPADMLMHPPAGTGFLVPATEGTLVTACTWLSAKWPHLARPGQFLLRASVGRAHDRRFLDIDDAELIEAVSKDLESLMGISVPPLEAKVTRWHDAFPQYHVGHLEMIDAIDNALRGHPFLALAGPTIGGPGIPSCIATARTVAAGIATRLGLNSTAAGQGTESATAPGALGAASAPGAPGVPGARRLDDDSGGC